MADLREARAAVLRRWNRDLADNFTAALPRLLDDLEQVDEAHNGQVIVKAAAELTPEQEAQLRAEFEAKLGLPPVILPNDPNDAQVEAWIDANPEKFAAWVRRQNRINGAPPGDAKPQPRRRTTRKADG